MCVCELFTTLPRPQSWAVKLEECGTGNPDRTRKKEIAKSLAATPLPDSQVPASQGAQRARRIWGSLSWGLGGGGSPWSSQRLISEIDFKGASQFVLSERRIFVCSLMAFGGRDMIPQGLEGWAPSDPSRGF